ncbi:hypothetical protein [Streptomyces sp. NPDC059816]|uniref:hypothetical protein n=1 Tax=Streptomyces sp. NPDC059816 TaxID=3346960 RepID=UPI00365CDA0F
MGEKNLAETAASVTVPLNVPPRYRELVEESGPPVGVEEARVRWGQLVAAAEAGAVTLITADTAARRGYPTWAAIAPLDRVADPGRYPMWPLQSARSKFMGVIEAATQLTGGQPQILTRHRRPVVAVVAAITLVNQPPAGERIDPDTLLREGGSITLEYDHGHPGSTGPDGDVDHEPAPPAYIAVAKTPEGQEIGQGVGDSIPDALLRLWRPPSHLYSKEPPFPNVGWSAPADEPWESTPRF